MRLLVVTWSTLGASPFLDQTSPGFMAWRQILEEEPYERFLDLRREVIHMGKAYGTVETQHKAHAHGTEFRSHFKGTQAFCCGAPGATRCAPFCRPAMFDDTAAWVASFWSPHPRLLFLEALEGNKKRENAFAHVP